MGLGPNLLLKPTNPSSLFLGTRVAKGKFSSIISSDAHVVLWLGLNL